MFRCRGIPGYRGLSPCGTTSGFTRYCSMPRRRGYAPVSVSDMCTATTGYDPTLRYTPTWGYTAISTQFATHSDSRYAPIRMGVQTNICIYSNIGEYPGFRGMPPSRDISRFHIWISHNIWECPRYPGIPRYLNLYIYVGVYPHVGVCPHQQGIP